MKTEDYLHRIGYTHDIGRNLETLSGLQRAHMLTVPFENLDIGLHRPIRIDQTSLWKKIVIGRRGGFCYELNGLFAWLLKVCGFDITYLDARDYHDEDGTLGIDFDHLTLLVRIPGGSARWLVDVGRGDSFTRPLDIDNPHEQVDGLRGYRLEPFRDGYQLWQRDHHGRLERQYYFDLTAHSFPSEYEATCLYHQTSPDSFFTKKRIISLLTEDGRVTLSERKFIRTTNGQRDERDVSDTEVPALLKEHFGVVLNAVD